jgi:hypothetical protein
MSERQLSVRPFRADEAERWDEFVKLSVNGTFLHSRRFLGYHANRFEDLSLWVVDSDERLVGLMPAAIGAPTDVVDSHPGITYGGLVHRGELSGEHMLAAFEAAAGFYRSRGYASLRYRSIPRPYQLRPSDDDSYAMFRLGAVRSRVDLAAGFEISARASVSHGRTYDLKLATKAGIAVETRSSDWPGFWVVLQETLASRHGSRPVHTLDEIVLLSERFPEEIELVLCKSGDAIVAGAVLFHTARVTHTQYLASSPNGRALGALSKVMEVAISRAQQLGRVWFSAGTNNEDGGRILNSGLYQWKLSFGSGGFVHETFELRF